MRSLTAVLCGTLAAATLAAPVAGPVAAPAAAEPSASRATQSGEIGAYSFPDEQGQTSATCVYKKGRLTGIVLGAPSAAGRTEWGGTGQWILWGATLQAKKGKKGAWRTVGATHYSEAEVRTAAQGGTLPPASIPHVFGAVDTQYRVVETVNWYLANTAQSIVQGKTSIVVQHYTSRRKPASTCEGVVGTRLPRASSPTNNELDAVNVSFAGRSHGAKIKYSVKSGALPTGLSLNRRTGAVTGTIAATASNATAAAATTTPGPPPGEAAYKHITPQAFAFKIAARANGRTTTKSYSWVVYDTAFVMPNYYGLYGCGLRCEGNKEPTLNISDLGPKFAFGCTTTPQPGIPANKYSVVYKQEYQLEDGTLASSVGATVVYGDVFKWWYYNQTC
jgi:hypothetical protein